MIRIYIMDAEKLKLTHEEINVALVLNAALEKEGLRVPVRIGKRSTGKPYLLDFEGLCFNGSHSGKYVCVALSNKPVGVDIQEKKNKGNELEIAKRFMAVEEYERLAALQKEKQWSAFYELWAQKESYMKYTGLGFSLPMNAFHVGGKENKIVEAGKVAENVKLINAGFDTDYALWICGEETEIEVSFLEV